ncbi:MAG: RdgB/HAM1 family non-canonical purine NTP pyrophosphatase [Chloroflexota bacterium]
MQSKLQNKILLATNNSGKVFELKELLSPIGKLQLITPQELGLNLNVEEVGKNYKENAVLKATAFSDASGLISLADDSGLEVQALDGSPGLYSARYSPKPNATDADRRAYLLANLSNEARPWRAQFRCVIALVAQGQETIISEGVCQGEIVPDERGDNGFGYDAIFYLPAVGKTMAELTDQEKNQISHRAKAVNNALPYLEQLFI